MTDNGPPVIEYRTDEVALGLMLWWVRETPDGTLGDLLADAALEGWIVPLTEFSDQDAAHLEYTQLKARMRELEAALRSLTAVEPIATYLTPDDPETWDADTCIYCLRRATYANDYVVEHAPDCPWASAKALVGDGG